MENVYKPIPTETKKEDLDSNSLSRSEVIDVLGISKSSFYKLLRHKILRNYKGSARISNESITAVKKYIVDYKKMSDGKINIEALVRFWKMKGLNIC